MGLGNNDEKENKVMEKRTRKSIQKIDQEIPHGKKKKKDVSKNRF